MLQSVGLVGLVPGILLAVVCRGITCPVAKLVLLKQQVHHNKHLFHGVSLYGQAYLVAGLTGSGNRVQFSSVPDGIYALGKACMPSTPSL